MQTIGGTAPHTVQCVLVVGTAVALLFVGVDKPQAASVQKREQALIGVIGAEVSLLEFIEHIIAAAIVLQSILPKLSRLQASHSGYSCPKCTQNGLSSMQGPRRADFARDANSSRLLLEEQSASRWDGAKDSFGVGRQDVLAVWANVSPVFVHSHRQTIGAKRHRARPIYTTAAYSRATWRARLATRP